jgi:hypothetical protein
MSRIAEPQPWISFILAWTQRLNMRLKKYQRLGLELTNVIFTSTLVFVFHETENNSL